MIDIEKIKKAAQLSADREFRIPEAGEEDRRYTGAEIAWLEFVSLATPSAVLALFTEIDRLKAELECAVGDILTATQIIERNQKDADRYRLIRDKNFSPTILCSQKVYAKYFTEYMLCDDQLDLVLDEAITTRGKS